MFCKVIALFLLVVGTHGDIPCRNVTGMPGFDHNRTNGSWYAQEYSGDTPKVEGDCFKYVVVSSTTVNKSKRLNNTNYVEDVLTIVHQDESPGKYIFKPDNNTNIPYWWVDTDYISYGIMYVCNDGKGSEIVTTRNRILSDATKAKVDEALKRNGFITDKALRKKLYQSDKCKN